MKKSLATLLAAAGIFVSYVSPAIAAQANGSDEAVFKVATARGRYQAIATFDPITRHGKFFAPSALRKQTRPDKSWIANEAAGIDFTAPEEQGIYNMCIGDCHKLAPLVVSAEPDHPTASTVVIVPDLTWQAYNVVGGGSLYTDFKKHKDGLNHFSFGVSREHPLGLHSLSKVNLNRPLFVKGADGINKDLVPATNPIAFLREEGHSVDVVSQTALNYYNYDLSKYRTIVLYGHDEYWTDRIENLIVDAVRTGTNLLNLSGNTGYRQILLNNSVISFPQSAAHKDLSARPFDVTNQVLPMLGVRYVEYPVTRHLTDRKIKFTKNVYKALLDAGFPKQIGMKRALHLTAGIKLAAIESPMLTGVVADKRGFIGVKSKVASYELDGVPLDKSFGLSEFALNVLQDKNADIFGRGWAGMNHITLKPPMGQVGMLVAKYFGKGRVISVGSMGWMPALFAKDPNIVTLTKNFFNTLDAPAAQTESQVEWSAPAELLNDTELGVVDIAPHEEAEITAHCFKSTEPKECQARREGGRIILKVNTPIDSADVSVTFLGASGFRVFYEPKDFTQTFRQP